MVLCHYFNPRAGCDEAFAATENPLMGVQACKTPVDCAKIAGCDHLTERRARKFRCKSKRVSQLALPKNVTVKYCYKEPEQGQQKIEIVRTYEEVTPARIKQLALPKVRKLISSKEDNNNVIDKQRRGHYDIHIKRSLQTMYSRFAKVEIPSNTKRSKWTSTDWLRHCEWLKKRALPKTPPSMPQTRSKQASLAQIVESVQRLSTPSARYQRQKYRRRCGFKSTVESSALLYEPSQATLRLALPRQRKVEDDFDPFQVNPHALKYEITDAIIHLATPKSFPTPDANDNLSAFGVIKRALKAKLDPEGRVMKLSKPRERKDEDEDEERPLVNPKALKAKATKRIIKLAQPRLQIKN